ADFWRQWLIEGKVEKIPLFAYVYHEYGPLRMDGWAKLSPEMGDIFYWVASRVTLWGGLFELNYEFSPLEMLGGRADDPQEHYYRFARREYQVDPEKVAFLREVARARTGWANPYLAYGTMRRPPSLAVAPITLDYFLYNCAQRLPHYEERGTITVPGVVCSAWSYLDQRAAVLLVNLQTHPQTVEVRLDPQGCGLEEAQEVNLYRVTNDGASSLGIARAGEAISVALPPRRIVGLEMRPAPGDAGARSSHPGRARSKR
ncbi:MAG: hypothetical protein QME94_19055, partial [Anaerolineae bacterium]|nr:hypothetical protein [Anaerolineae bacterium]